jgi:hypothetical protein
MAGGRLLMPCPSTRPLSLVAMGFNPFRRQRKTMIDVLVVVGFAVIILGFVLWGFFG